MASLVDSWQITWVRVSDNMGEKLSVSAPYVGNPLLPSRLHDDDVHQQHNTNELSMQSDGYFQVLG